jgi:C-terminal processing protease CtpA/Prc
MVAAMRLSVPLCLCVSFLLCLHSASGSAAEPLTDKQIARLESLCRVWGTAKFFHPWIVAPPDGKPIDWDAALIESIPRVEKASTPEEFRAAIDHLLQALHDEPTRAYLPSQNPAAINRAPGAGPIQTPAADPAPAESKVVDRGNKKILVITATDWRRLAAFERKTPGELFKSALAEANEMDAIILDLRRLRGSVDDVTVFVGALHSAFAALIKTDVTLPAWRTRFHSGYAPEQGETSGGYFSGFSITEPSNLKANPGPAAGKPLLILTNPTVGRPADLVTALQCSGQAIVLHQGGQLQPSLVSAPGMPSPEMYSMALSDGVIARVRTGDSMNADGSFGFTPDLVIENEQDTEELMAAALAIAAGERERPARTPKRYPPVPTRITEKTYPEMRLPNREYRLLGLFRVWNVMYYFFPYKQHMDRTWDSVLTEFVPRFADAETLFDFSYAIREFVAQLQDSHVNASGGAANAVSANVGGVTPLISVSHVGGELVVTARDDSVKNQVNVGDVIVEIDGETVAARKERLKKYQSASTPQSLDSRLALFMLRGQPPEAKIALRDAAGVRHERSLPRPVGPDVPAKFRTLFESTRRKTPVFSVLSEGYGYFDLVRLTVQQVNAAFNTVKETPALIMDMRGYPQGTGWSICSRLTDKPMTMATFRRHYWTTPYSVEDRWAFDQRIQPSPLWKYTGRIVVLINEMAYSQSEHSCLGFEEAAKGRITFIGTPTTGANGDVTNTSMPGGIRISFSGHDVRHADGRQLQRVGIQPDIRVEPTIAGIVAGQDEVLEAAIKFLNESKPQ